MQWNLGWRLWWSDWWVAPRGAGKARPFEPQTLEDWEARLVEEGVSEDWAERIALQLESAHRRLGRGTSTALIQGASLAVAVQAGERANVERSMRDVREVERLLGAFSGELEKLDEVLEVLSAYAQRMRSKPATDTDRILH